MPRKSNSELALFPGAGCHRKPIRPERVIEPSQLNCRSLDQVMESDYFYDWVVAYLWSPDHLGVVLQRTCCAFRQAIRLYLRKHKSYIPTWPIRQFVCTDMSRHITTACSCQASGVAQLQIRNLESEWHTELLFARIPHEAASMISVSLSMSGFPHYSTILVAVAQSPETCVLLVQNYSVIGPRCHAHVLGGIWPTNSFGDVCNWNVLPTTRLLTPEPESGERCELFTAADQFHEVSLCRIPCHDQFYFYDTVDSASDLRIWATKTRTYVDLESLLLRAQN